MCEDCDWPACFSLCEEICKVVGYLCVCCIKHYEENNRSKCSTQETNFTNPVNSNETSITQQPVSQGDSCSPQQFGVQQCQPSNSGAQQYPTAPNSGLNPSAPLSENNCASNQTTGGITSSIYPALPPSYAEAVGQETC